MSELLRTACDEARKGNCTIKQQVRDIGSKLLNNVEISEREAVYIILQLPMRKSSCQLIFINISPPEERQHEAEGAQDLHPDFSENYDLSDDIGIPSTTSNNEQLILNELQDQDYRKMVQMLNKEQKLFFIMPRISSKHLINHSTVF